MNNKYKGIPNTTISRDTRDLQDKTENLYESVSIISRRANQITIELKEELNSKLEEFASEHDNLEEIFENREQIEISKHYEALPKPSLIAIEEFKEGKVYHRNPAKEDAKE